MRPLTSRASLTSSPTAPRGLGAALLLLLAALTLGACGGALTTTSGNALVKGRVLAPTGKPVVGAEVSALDGGTSAKVRAQARAQKSGALATTDDDGRFALPLPNGTHQILVKLGETVIARTMVTTSDFSTSDVGTLAIDETVDSDGDGLSDAIEQIGWDVVLNLSARRALTTRAVTSDPAVADTDGDGLSDADEMASLTDPTRRDSDGDGLSDLDELERYASNPTDVDTDRDAAETEAGDLANPGLYDGNEVHLKRTSPTLADTDGDGLTDYEELVGGGLDPRRADVAQIVLEPIGDPEVALNVESTVTQERATEAFRLTRDAEALTVAGSIEATVSAEYEHSVEGEIGASIFQVGPDIKSTNTFKTSISTTGTFSQTKESRRETEQSYRENVGNNSEVRVVDGSLRVAFRVRNTSNRGVIVSDLSVLAMRIPPTSVGTRRVVGQLTPAEGFPAFVLLAPGGEFSFVAENLHLNAQSIQQVVASPGTLYFEIANYTLSQADDMGTVRRDYAALGERIMERCATVAVDFGGGRYVQHILAANVDRNPDGSSQGLLLIEALRDILGFHVGTEELLAPVRNEATGTVDFVATGLQVLSSLRESGRQAVTSNIQGRVLPFTGAAFWRMDVRSGAVDAVRVEGVPDDLPPSFDTIRIKPGDSVTLSYVVDTDGDGVSDGSERFLGTSPTQRDTDGDGLRDDEELFEGWTISFDGDVEADYAYVVRSDPTQRDTDGDGLRDGAERAFTLATPSGTRTVQTDPNRADTDLDGIPDVEDTSPLELLTGDSSFLVAARVHYPFNRGADADTGLVRSYLDDSRLVSANRLDAWPALLPDLRPTVYAGIYDGRDRHGADNRAVRLVGARRYVEGVGPVFDAPFLELPAPELDSPTGAYSVSLWFKPSTRSFYAEGGAAMRVLGHVNDGQGPRLLLENGRYVLEVPTQPYFDKRLIPLRYTNGGNYLAILRDRNSLRVPLQYLTTEPEKWTNIVFVIKPVVYEMSVPTGVKSGSSGLITSVDSTTPGYPRTREEMLADFNDYDRFWVASEETELIAVPHARVEVWQDGELLGADQRWGFPLKPQPGVMRLGEVINFQGLPSGLHDLGLIDDVRFFARELEESEPAALYGEIPERR